jgi:peptidoglycan-associated lipoprotein
MPSLSPTAKLATIAAVLLLSACATKEPPPPPAALTAAPAPQAARPAPAPPPVVQNTIVPGSLKDFQQNVGDRVFFDFDKSDLDQTDQDTLKRQAAWLAKYPSVTITVEGHCDERGTREYNLALGARRAAAVKEYLSSLGVSAARLDTISYGKERPVCSESAENCWAMNRRGVSVIKSGAIASAS